MEFNLTINLILFVVLFTGFLKASLVFTVLGKGLGLHSLVFSIIALSLALLLSLQSLMHFNPQLLNTLSFSQEVQLVGEDVKKIESFLQDNSDASVYQKFSSSIGKEETVENSKKEFYARALAFILTELKEAFFIAAMLLIPFLFVDFLLAIVASAVSLKLPLVALALPIKLMVFLQVDGWLALSEKILTAYKF